MLERGLVFLGLVPPEGTVNSESVVDIQCGDSGVVIGYQVEEFTHTWSIEWFAAHSHIYHGFMGKAPSLNHLLPEPGCEDYSFLHQSVTDFKLGLDSILTGSIKTPELDTSFDKPDVITSSVSSGFLHSVSTILILLNHSLLLASDLINNYARLGHFFPCFFGH